MSATNMLFEPQRKQELRLNVMLLLNAVVFMFLLEVLS